MISSGLRHRDRSPSPSCQATDGSLSLVTLNPREFDQFRALLKEVAGIHLGPDKLRLVQARLGKRMRQLGLQSFRNYRDRVVGPGSDPQELLLLIDAVSTHTTSFFREEAQFELLASTLGDSCFGSHFVRILSAGCSSGEEPYSIAMSALEALGDGARTRVLIEAGDVSIPVIQRAARAIYPMNHVDGLSLDRIRRFFLRGTGPQLGQVRPVKMVRQMVNFRPMNLITGEGIGNRYNAIFCRNVTIYFDRPTQARVFQMLGERLEPGGLLFVGHSESLLSVTTNLRFIRPSVYQCR